MTSIKGKQVNAPKDLPQIYAPIISDRILDARLKRIATISSTIERYKAAINELEQEHEYHCAQIEEYEKRIEIPAPDIIARIQGEIDKRGISHTFLARNTGIPTNRISEFLNRKRKISKSAAIAFSKHFEIPLQEFFN